MNNKTLSAVALTSARTLLCCFLIFANGKMIGESKAQTPFWEKWFTDPSYEPDFILGPVTFHVPNRWLDYPFKTGQEPDSTTCKTSFLFRDHYADLCSKLVNNLSFGMHMQLDLVGSSGKHIAWTSEITVLYGNGSQYPEPMLLKFPAQRQYTLPISHVPEFDTKRYQAFELSTNLRSSRSTNNTRHHSDIMLRTNDDYPQIVVCERSSLTESLDEASCTAEFGYLLNRFPKRSDNTYPFSIWFTVPGWAIDQSADLYPVVESFVTKFMKQD